MWHDDNYDNNGDHWDDDNNEDKFFEWDDGYKKRKAQKAKLKKKSCPLLGIHQDIWIDVCHKIKKKHRQKNCGHKWIFFCIW